VGHNLLTERGTRRYARRTGLPIEKMLAFGSNDHWLAFRTADHRHGHVRATPPYEVRWDMPYMHWADCPPGYR
jgi:hypothetical protein